MIKKLLFLVLVAVLVVGCERPDENKWVDRIDVDYYPPAKISGTFDLCGPWDGGTASISIQCWNPVYISKDGYNCKETESEIVCTRIP
jgi:hypothetical protein